ncbi:MAG TPA: hypothetical protein VGX94_05780 [Terriglobia bacterium]|nr:hypothetical protein [Terriglobia bacterium]
MHQAERDARAYKLAKEYLLGLPSVTPEVIEKHLNFPDTAKPPSIPIIYERILESAKNTGMKKGVIGEVKKLRPVLCDFNPTGVLKKFPTLDWKPILDEIEAVVKPSGKIRRTGRAIWPHYCQTILSAARFLEQFSSCDDFYRWLDFFDRDPRSRPALPWLVAQEIDGFGFALACDFLKELGYANFAKPDVHLRHIFTALGLCSDDANDYELFKAIVRVAQHAGLTPYSVDKAFWLIGSGYFYRDKQIGRNGRTGSHEPEFIALAQRTLAAED